MCGIVGLHLRTPELVFGIVRTVGTEIAPVVQELHAALALGKRTLTETWSPTRYASANHSRNSSSISSTDVNRNACR